MRELDIFLLFMLDHKEDERVKIHKKMKYGYQHFFVEFWADTLDKSAKQIFYRPSLTIIIDNRNKCIEVSSERRDSSIVIEDEELTKKWSQKIDEMLKSDLEKDINQLIESTLQECENKNLHREYLMKKIFTDESI